MCGNTQPDMHPHPHMPTYTNLYCTCEDLTFIYLYSLQVYHKFVDKRNKLNKLITKAESSVGLQLIRLEEVV